MNSPFGKSPVPAVGFLVQFASLLLFCALSLALGGCGGKIVKETLAEAKTEAKAPPAPPSIPGWLGNPERNFYGTGPWEEGPSRVFWEIETSSISGRLHKDEWSGTSCPASLR